MHPGASTIQVRLQPVGSGDFSERIEDTRVPFYERVLGPPKYHGLVFRSLKTRKANGSELALVVRLGGHNPEMRYAVLIIQGVQICLASVDGHVLRGQIESVTLHLNQVSHMSSFLFRKAKRSYDVRYVDRR